MKWNEFASLLSGIGADSPLGRLVQIRLEDDKDVLKTLHQANEKSATSGVLAKQKQSHRKTPLHFWNR